MKAVVAAFNQEKALVGALVGAFSVITNIRMELFGALMTSCRERRVQPAQVFTVLLVWAGALVLSLEAGDQEELCWLLQM